MKELHLVQKYAPYDGLNVLEVGAAHHFSKLQRRAAKTALSYTGLDMLEHECVDIVWNLNEPLDISPFDVVLLFSVLEHCDKPWLVAENIQNVLKPGGLIMISAPFVWRVHNYPDDYFRYTPSGLRTLFPTVEPIEEFNHKGLDLRVHQREKIQVFMVGRKRA